MADDISPAQGQDTAAASAEGAVDESKSQATQFAGFQKRVDELTAKFHAADKRAEEAQAREMELMRMLAERQAPAQLELPPEIDPDQRKTVEAVLSPYQRKMEQQIARLEAALGQQEMRSAEQGHDPEVIARANALMTGWRKAGHSFLPIDALTFAAGEIALKQKAAVAQGRDAQGRFNAAGGSVTGNTTQPTTPAPKQIALPLDFNSRDASVKALAELEKHLADKVF